MTARVLLALAFALPAFPETGNAPCARCHAEIARQYAATGMAQASGRTTPSNPKESFDHPTAAQATVTPAFQLQLADSTRQLEWFLGSGRIGRSYLFRKANQLFQSPLSYYSQPQKWDVSPGYENRPYLELTRLVEPACLQCHSSRLQPASSPQPFLEPGVSCERCHGPGEKHIALPTPRNIVNPAKLAPIPRASVCAQCHLTGAARIARANRDRSSYTPGEPLSNSLAIFVWNAPPADSPSATSHFEKLATSRCQQASGDKLWCGSCHPAHADATPAQYNQKCQTCHSPGTCKANAGDACITCHMPKRAPTRSIEHLAFTDHSIPRRPTPPTGLPSTGTLKEFWTGLSNPRDTAMAYAAAAVSSPHLRPSAYAQLQAAAPANPKDVPLLAQLAQFHERMGRQEPATTLYTQILTLDPTHPAAAINLGTALIRQGKSAEAIALWLRALANNPGLIGARLNLAVAQFQSGDRLAARKSLLQVLDYEPNHPTARQMLNQIPE